MREIKFRAWDKEAKKMWYPSAIASDGRNIALVNQFGVECTDTQGDVLMQFTGLKDKKRTKEYPEGQEIYEGDIVKTKDLKGKIVYRNDGAMFDLQANLYNGGLLHLEDIEVIGNMYENPELLKEVI